MGKAYKLFEKIIKGQSDNNIMFNELWILLTKLGFEVRIKRSHYIYYKEGAQEIINIQEISGHSKAYQVKQIREIIINYKLEIQEDEEL